MFWIGINIQDTEANISPIILVDLPSLSNIVTEIITIDNPIIIIQIAV